MLEAITKAGYTPGDADRHRARSGGQRVLRRDKKKYVFKKSDKSERSSDQMVKFWEEWVQPISDHFD